MKLISSLLSALGMALVLVGLGSASASLIASDPELCIGATAKWNAGTMEYDWTCDARCSESPIADCSVKTQDLGMGWWCKLCACGGTSEPDCCHLEICYVGQHVVDGVGDCSNQDSNCPSGVTCMHEEDSTTGVIDTFCEI